MSVSIKTIVQGVVQRIPYPFQELVIRNIVPKNRVALFMEMRLGKTFCIMQWLKRKNLLNKRGLIVCPLSVVPVWEKEMTMEGIKFITFQTRNKELERVLQFWNGPIITNYEALTRTVVGKDEDDEKNNDSELDEVKFDYVILDESQRIRKIQAKVSRICSTKFDYVPYRALLTGTPAPESLLDYFQQFKFLIGSFLGETSFYEFKSRYFYTSYGSSKPEIKIQMVPIVKAHIKEHSIILRRSNPLVMENLKNKKIYEQRYTFLEPAAQQAYDEFEKTWMLKARDQNNNKDVFTNWVIVAQNYLHQMSGGFIKGTNEYWSDHKVKVLKEIMDDEIPGERLVIFSRYRKEIDQVAKYLQSDYKVATITGDVEVRQRLKLIDQLGEGNLDALICQIKTASVGINMSCCDTCVYYSNTWEMADRLQSEDRLVGPKTNEKSSLLYIDLLTKNTIDEDLYNALQMKKERTDLDFLEQVYKRFKARMGM